MPATTLSSLGKFFALKSVKPPDIKSVRLGSNKLVITVAVSSSLALNIRAVFCSSMPKLFTICCVSISSAACPKIGCSSTSGLGRISWYLLFASLRLVNVSNGLFVFVSIIANSFLFIL